MMILEREAELAEFASLLDGIDLSGGRVVLVRGEAGIGKSALINRFLSDADDRSVTHLGACDDLLTPQPFGPICDIGRTEPSLAQPLSDGDRRGVMDAVLDLLSRPTRPTVVVLEDTQWADEATLDLIKFLGRRIARTHGLLVLTYRDVEVDADHPLRQVIGEIPPQSLVRMLLGRLSVEAVMSMIDSDSVDAETIMALTHGNPLFVTEVLASGTDAVPLSVKDSVLARVSKVSTAARRVLDVVSVVPGEIERSLVDEIVGPTEEHLAEAIRQGLLRVEDRSMSFPHDLQRRAVEASLTQAERRQINQQVLNSLGDSADSARLVHHAKEAGDVAAMVEFAPLAARAAMAIGSTSEAVAHFRALELLLDRFDKTNRAHILADWAQGEAYLDNLESVELFDRAIAAHRTLGGGVHLARVLDDASQVNREFGRHSEALDYSAEAVEILEQHGPSMDLVQSLSNRAFLEFVYTDNDATVSAFIDRAMSLAEEVGGERALAIPLKVKAHLLYSRGDPSGMTLMDENLRSAEVTGDHWGEVVALGNMAGMYGDVRDLARASDFALRARETAARYEFRSREVEANVMFAEFQLWKGDWESAENAATGSLGSNPSVEALAWRILGIIQTRRGRNEARSAILRMWSLVAPDDGPTATDPTAAALAEYVWLSGDRDPEIVSWLEEVLAEGIALGTPWPSGAFAFWMWKLGLLDAAPPGTADFYGWIISGDYSKSVGFWRDKGVPYEEGLALMHGDENEQIEAIRIFDDLGAAAAANKVRQVLKDNGVRVPRGASRTTRDHAAGLTARQSEVLELLSRGLTNIEIADELFVSHRTVENHVSAVLMKLDVPSREAAVAAAADWGILGGPANR